MKITVTWLTPTMTLLVTMKNLVMMSRVKQGEGWLKKVSEIALAFVPGLALIDILSDLGDILSVATEADEAS